MTSTARDVMTGGAQCVSEDDTVAGGSEVVTIGAEDPLDEARRTLEEHQVRRLPVIDGHRLVGIISQGDLAQALPDAQTGQFVESISEE